jgi:hypothetical protein
MVKLKVIIMKYTENDAWFKVHSSNEMRRIGNLPSRLLLLLLQIHVIPLHANNIQLKCKNRANLASWCTNFTPLCTEVLLS